MKNIIICAAKTGGHIFPALGFAKEALKNDYKITFLGTNTDPVSYTHLRAHETV